MNFRIDFEYSEKLTLLLAISVFLLTPQIRLYSLSPYSTTLIEMHLRYAPLLQPINSPRQILT